MVVVLGDGALAAMGDHESLMEADGLYADLFRRQSLEEELDAI